VDRIPPVTQVAAEAAQFWWSYLVHVYNPVIQLAATLFTNQAWDLLRQLTPTDVLHAPGVCWPASWRRRVGFATASALLPDLVEQIGVHRTNPDPERLTDAIVAICSRLESLSRLVNRLTKPHSAMPTTLH